MEISVESRCESGRWIELNTQLCKWIYERSYIARNCGETLEDMIDHQRYAPLLLIFTVSKC